MKVLERTFMLTFMPNRILINNTEFFIISLYSADRHKGFNCLYWYRFWTFTKFAL